MRDCHLTMLGIHAWNFRTLNLGFILEAIIERECPYTCLRMLKNDMQVYWEIREAK